MPDMTVDYDNLITNNANTNPQETDLRDKLFNNYMKQLAAQSIISPIARGVDVVTGSYSGGKNAPIGAISAMVENPEMQQMGNVIGWMGKGNQRNGNVNPLALARYKNLEEQRDWQQGFQEKKYLQDQVEKLSKRSESSAGIVSNIKDLTTAIPDLYDKDSKNEIPGIGVAYKNIPIASLSNEAQTIRQRSIALVAGYIYLRSGKQINEEESNRFMKIAGMSWDSGTNAFRSGMIGLNNEIKQLMKNIEAGYDPKAIDVYVSRGGTKSSMLPTVKGGNSRFANSLSQIADKIKNGEIKVSSEKGDEQPAEDRVNRLRGLLNAE